MKLLFAFAVLFFAADSAHSEWVAGVYLGDAHTAKSSLRIQAAAWATNLYIHPVPYATNAFQSPIYYGYHAGYFFTRHFGFEGEFTHLKVYAQTERVAQISGTLRGVAVKETVPLNTVVQRFNITHGVNLLTGTFVVRTAFHQRIPHPRFILSGRMGAGITIPHAEDEILGITNAEHYQMGSPVIQVGADFEIRLWHTLYFDTGVKYTRTRENVNLAQGTAESPLDSTHVTGGFTWHL
jgi:hypothetical protein